MLSVNDNYALYVDVAVLIVIQVTSLQWLQVLHIIMNRRLQPHSRFLSVMFLDTHNYVCMFCTVAMS